MQPSLQPPTEAAQETTAAEPAAGVWHTTYRVARRVVVAVVGATVLLIGVVLLVTPGPAFIVIPVGLGILSLEFSWARRWLKKVKDTAGRVISSGETPPDKGKYATDK